MQLDLIAATRVAADALFHDERLWFGFTDAHKDLGGPREARLVAAMVAATAIAEEVERQVREKIAQDIEAHGKASHDSLERAELPVNPRYTETIVLSIAQAAAIARGASYD